MLAFRHGPAMVTTAKLRDMARGAHSSAGEETREVIAYVSPGSSK